MNHIHSRALFDISRIDFRVNAAFYLHDFDLHDFDLHDFDLHDFDLHGAMDGAIDVMAYYAFPGENIG